MWHPQSMRFVEASYSLATTEKDNFQCRNSSFTIFFQKVGNEIWVSEVLHIAVVIPVYSQITSLSWYCHFSLWKEFWFVFIFNYSFCSTEHFINSIICEVDFCTWLAKQMIFLSQNSSLYARSLWESLHILRNSIVKHNSTSFNIVWEPVDFGCLICFFNFFFYYSLVI